MDSNLDFMGALLDEIALEGLDGITLPSLWKRLANRPHFAMPLDENTKQFLWGCIFQHRELEMFQLEQARPPLVIYNRYNNLDLEMGIVLDIDEPVVEIYPHTPVQSTEVKGSCSTFATRKNVSQVIKIHGKSYTMSMNIYGEERLVLVGSQELRNQALFGTETQPNIELSQLQYCLLERIGRSRYHGEVTMGKLSLATMKIASKNMFYLRKLLLKINLITKQLHLQRLGNATVHSSLFHLRRFYVERLSKLQVMIIKMCEVLEQKPNKKELFHVLRKELGMKETSFKKMFNKVLQGCVQAKMVPYGEFYPDATEEKRFSANGKERQVKIACLVKKYEEPEEEDFEDEDEEAKNEIILSLDPRKITFDEPILTQMYNIIEKMGSDGMAANALIKDLGFSKLEIRLLLRNLERRNVIFSYFQDVGRQRALFYVAKCFEQESLENNNLMEMKKKISSYSSECVENETYDIPMVSQDTFNEMDTIVVDFHEEDKSEVLTKAWNFSLKDISSVCKVPSGKSSRDKDSPNYTYKMLKRVNLVIEAVRKNRLIEDTFYLQKLIIQTEQEEGLSEKIDKKSTHRIISRLAKDGYIRSIKTSLTMGKRVKKLHFVCDRTLTADDPLIRSAIEQAKMKYFSVSKPNDLSIRTPNLAAVPDVQGIGDSGVQLRNITNPKEGKAKMEYIPSIGRVYGLQPKFLRMKSLHQFIFYLVYEYKGSPNPIQSQEENSPPVYELSVTWKRFVPPLPQHAGKKKGWCLVSDILLCMPLSLLMKVVNFTYKIEGLEEFILDPIKQHYLIRHLPQLIRNALLQGRKYIFSVHEVMTKLSFMGLLTFGPQQYKEKDQVFIYIHQNATLKDTTLSEPGYITTTPNLDYVYKKYHMETTEDTENYWYDLESLCLRTPLGSPGCSRDKTIEVKNLFKDSAMIEAARQKSPDEVDDSGETPGDGLGAAGLDSAMFAHLRRNWAWPAEAALQLNRFSRNRSIGIGNDSGYGAGMSYKNYLVQKDKEITVLSDPSKTKRLSRLLGVNKLLLSSDKPPIIDLEAEELGSDPTQIETSLVPNIKNRKGYKRKAVGSPVKPPAKRQKKSENKIKTILKKKTKPRKPYYDEVDKMALNRMSKQRVCWTVQEDSFLLLCKVTSCFLDPHFKSMVIPFSTIREFMHRRFPALSANKTSRACQRRICYMMRNPTTVANVSVFLLEAKQDVELVRQFQGPKPIKRDEATWTDMFTTVLDHLIEKFTLSLKDRCVQLALPNSLDEFNSLYKVSITGAIKDNKCMHVDPKNFVDIYCSVMFCFILSSMFTIGDKNNWSYTLYKAYQQYPDTLLRSVVARLKRDRLITKRKDFNSRVELTVPLSSLPHKISVHFDSNLQPRYQHEIYNQAAALFKNMTKDHSLSHPQGLDLSGSVDPGDTALIVSLTATHNVVFNIQVPEQVIIFDNSITEDLKSRIREKVRQYEQEDAQDLTQIEKDEIITTAEAGFEVSSSKASRIALYMLRHELGHSVSDNLQHAHDYFLINTCGIRCILRLHRHNKWYPLSPFKAQSAMDAQRMFVPLEVVSPTLEIIQAAYINSGYSSDVAEDGAKLIDFIMLKKEFGATFPELYHLIVTDVLNLKEHLKILMLNDLILRVGVTCFRYVALFYSKPWVLNSIKVSKDKRSKLTNFAIERDNQTFQDLKSRSKNVDLISLPEIGQLTDVFVDRLPTNNDLVIEEPSHCISTNAATCNVIEEASEVDPTTESDSALDKSDIGKDFVKNATVKVRNYSVESGTPESALICADSLFQLAVTMLQCFSEEKTPEHLFQLLESLPENVKEIFFPPSTIVETIAVCAQKFDIACVLQSLGSSDFVKNVLTFLATMENKVEAMDMKDLFLSVFCANFKESLHCNDDLLSIFTQLISGTLLKGFEILLNTYKFCNILQALNILTISIHELKTKYSIQSMDTLVNWFEDTIMLPLESLTNVQQSLPSVEHKGKQCPTKDIENWFENSFLKKLDGNNESLKETLESGVRFCVEDLLNKAGLISETSFDDISDWFQNIIMNQIESEDLKSWLQNCILTRLETLECDTTSLNAWFVETVLSRLELSISGNEKFLQSWLDETIISKVIERNETLELREWMERILQIVTNDEKNTTQEKSELRNWMNNFILKRVEDIERKEIEKQSFKKWFDEKVLSIFDIPESPETVTCTHPSSIKNLLSHAIQVIENREDIQRFKDTRKKISEIIQAIHVADESRLDFQKWFTDSIMLPVQQQCDNSKELLQWFEENILKVLELSQENRVVDVQEVKLWLEEEIVKLLSDSEGSVTIGDLQEWFQTHILNVIDTIDQDKADSSEVDTENLFTDKKSCEESDIVSTEIEQWFEDNVFKALEDLQNTNMVCFQEIKHWFEENVMKRINRTESLATVEIKEWFEQHILQVIQDSDQNELKSDVKACLRKSVLDVLERLSEAKECLETDVLDVVTRNIETADCLERNVLQVIVSNSEIDNAEASAAINNSIKSKVATESQPDISSTESEAAKCMDWEILDVIQTTSDMIDSLSTESLAAVKPSSDNTASFTSLPPDDSDVMDCLQESLLDAIEKTAELQTLAPQIDCVSSLMVESRSCLENSLLDVIDTTTDMVHFVDKQLVVNEFIKIDVLVSSTSCEMLQSETSKSDSPANTCSIESIPHINQEVLPTSIVDQDVKESMENDILRVVDESLVPGTRSLINKSVNKSNQSEIHIETDKEDQDFRNEIPNLLQQNVLDVIEATSELISSVKESSISPTSTIVETLQTDVFSQVSECLVDSVLMVVDKVSDCLDQVESFELVESTEIDRNSNVRECIEDSLLDVIDSTSELLTSVQESELLEVPLKKRQKISHENICDEQITNRLININNPECSTNLNLVTGKEKTPAEDSELEGRGKRKRRRTSMFTFSRANTTDSEPVRFISRPWRKPDGSLNRKALERYLITILGHVMTNTGISETDLFLRFEVTMQPVLILELLEILIECECLNIFHVKPSQVPGLFTDPIVYTMTSDWQPDSEVFYEATPDAILKLSYFLSEFLHYRT